MSIALDILYAAGLTAASPVWIYKMIRHGRYRDDIGQRLGAVPVRYGLQPTIWIHGVSLGEVNAARTLVEQLHSQLPDFRVVISTSTETGMAQARKLYAPDHLVFRWPLDFSAAVRAAIKRIRPAMVVLMEGEAWPNFLSECNRRKIPAVIVNARMSPDKGYPGYRRLGSFAAKLFNRLAAIGVQTPQYAELFASLGVDESKLHVTGMLKFDTIDIADELPGQAELAAAMGITAADKLIVAGGTGPGEEQMLVEMFKALRKNHSTAKLAIVPRKPERFEDVARTLAACGVSVVRRSQRPDGVAGEVPPDAILLGDTMGELRKFYALASAVFVGRSLVPMGGSDMIEAAALGKPIAFGPHTFNFPQADDLAANGCFRVSDINELQSLLETLLTDAQKAADAGAKAQSHVRSQQGATQRNVELICDLLDRAAPVAPGCIATDKIHE